MRTLADAFVRLRGLRLPVFHALNAWRWLFEANPRLDALGRYAWRQLVSRLPLRAHLLVGDPDAESPLLLPVDSRALVTTVKDAKLEHFDDVVRAAELLASGPDVERVFDAMTRGGDPFDFHLALNPRDIRDSRNAVFVQFAMQPRLVGLVQKYLGMPCRLKEVRVMLDRPTASEPRASQKWHRDPDDWMTVGVFVYLRDVDTNAAPFCYIPSHRCGSLHGRVGSFRRFSRWQTLPDAMMETLIPREHWVEVTGATGTATFVDIAACYHRVKPAVSSRRLSLQLVFTSAFTRMEMTERTARLFQAESERKYASESPEYVVASASRVHEHHRVRSDHE